MTQNVSPKLESQTVQLGSKSSNRLEFVGKSERGGWIPDTTAIIQCEVDQGLVQLRERSMVGLLEIMEELKLLFG